METKEIGTKTKWAIDKTHSEIEFKIKHLMISNIKGSFKEFDGSIYTTGENFMSSEIDFCLNPASIQTGDEERDKHLKGADFFDVTNHKKITFVGDSFVKVDRVGHYELYGGLTIKGITKQIKLHVEFGGMMKDSWGNEKVGFTIHGLIDRNDWDLTWNSSLQAGGLLLSEQVAISCEVQLIKQ